MNNNSDWHLQTQNGEYLDLSIKRLNEPALIWVSQFTDIINSKMKSIDKPELKINDIGCNVGHFYRNIDQITSKVNYAGFDISKTYLDIARSHFPEASFIQEDIGNKNFDKKKYTCDVSIISATLEHIEDYEQFLENVFLSTRVFVLIRTFTGDKSLKDYCLKLGANNSYLIRQFKINDLINRPFNNRWSYSQIIDKATDGCEKEVCENIIRKQEIILFANLDYLT